MHESDIMAVGSGGFYETEWMWSLLISGLLLLTVEKKILGLNLLLSSALHIKNILYVALCVLHLW